MNVPKNLDSAGKDEFGIAREVDGLGSPEIECLDVDLGWLIRRYT